MKPLIYMVCVAMLAGQAFAAGSRAETAKHIQQFEQGLAPPVLVKGETPKLVPLASRMGELHVPGVSIAVIHQGRIEWANGYGVTQLDGPRVTENTLFQAASISKAVFALAVMRQVEAGKLNLDANVNDYLKSWKLPDNAFTAEQKVTLRRVLSHTAGLTVHGFPGYEAGAKLPTTIQILDGASPANNPEIRVDTIPGSLYRYSGGGYTLAQLLMRDVTGQELPEAHARHRTGSAGHVTQHLRTAAARVARWRSGAALSRRWHARDRRTACVSRTGGGGALDHAVGPRALCTGRARCAGRQVEGDQRRHRAPDAHQAARRSRARSRGRRQHGTQILHAQWRQRRLSLCSGDVRRRRRRGDHDQRRQWRRAHVRGAPNSRASL